jgi:hypothetical protein
MRQPSTEPSEATSFLGRKLSKELSIQVFRSHYGPENFIIVRLFLAKSPNRTQRSE